MLNKIKEALNAWRSELNQLERDLEKNLQRLAFLQEAPLPPEDLADIVVDRMSGISDHYFHLRIEKKLGALLHRPLTDWCTQKKLADTRSNAKRQWNNDESIRKKYQGNYDSYLNRSFEPHGFWPGFIGGSSVDANLLFWALREPISTAIRDAIIGWDNYPKAGPPLAERQREIPKLEKAITKLREQIESSRRDAESVGVDAGELHRRPRIPTRPRDLK